LCEEGAPGRERKVKCANVDIEVEGELISDDAMTELWHVCFMGQVGMVFGLFKVEVVDERIRIYQRGQVE